MTNLLIKISKICTGGDIMTAGGMLLCLFLLWSNKLGIDRFLVLIISLIFICLEFVFAIKIWKIRQNT